MTGLNPPSFHGLIGRHTHLVVEFFTAIFITFCNVPSDLRDFFGLLAGHHHDPVAVGNYHVSRPDQNTSDHDGSIDGA